MSDLPRTVVDMRAFIGDLNGWNGLQKASQQVADWVVSAAEERWEDLFDCDDFNAIYDRAWTNAVERWGVELTKLRDDLLRAELVLLREGGPVA